MRIVKLAAKLLKNVDDDIKDTFFKNQDMWAFFYEDGVSTLWSYFV
jgi:hypothetical protein